MDTDIYTIAIKTSELHLCRIYNKRGNEYLNYP